MPNIRPISDLRNNANEISDFCRQTREPVNTPPTARGHWGGPPSAAYARPPPPLDLYGKLAVAEQEIVSGAQGEDFLTMARQLRERVHGTL